MLQEKSMIVTLNIAQWSARKHDRSVSREVEANHQAHNAGRYNKILAAKSYIQKIQKAAGKARSFHYENTLPWGENGERLLPSKNYFTYSSKMMELKAEFEKATDHFIGNYPAVIADAKIRLNGMFREADYPDAGQIADKFRFKVSFSNVPETDFRVKLSEKEKAALKASAEQAVQERLDGAVKDTWQRIKEAVKAVSERLTNKDAIFRDSLFENIGDLVTLLPKLNITNDPDISQACEEIKSLIQSPDVVRSSQLLRSETADKADQILDQFKGFFN